MDTDWLQGFLFGAAVVCLCVLPILNANRPRR